MANGPKDPASTPLTRRGFLRKASQTSLTLAAASALSPFVLSGCNKGGPGGLLKWSRRGRVLSADPAREFAFATEEGGRESTVWRYRFEPVDGGTRVTESYEVKRIPAWARIVDIPTNRHRELREAMQHTLERLKSAAEVRDEAGRQ